MNYSIDEQSGPVIWNSTEDLRAKREKAPFRDLTGKLMGDPKVGFSALDEKRRRQDEK